MARVWTFPGRRVSSAVAAAFMLVAAGVTVVRGPSVARGGELTKASGAMVYQGTAGPGPYEVVDEAAEWLDQSRSRAVKVRIYAPVSGSTSGLLPVIFISHGMGENRDSYGYIVVAMTHESSDTEALRQLQAGASYLTQLDHFTLRFDDLSFAIDRLLADDQPSVLIKGRADRDRIGIAGHSMGGDTAFQAIGMTINLPNGGPTREFRDRRVKAALQMGPHVGSAADPPGSPQDTPLKRAITSTAYDRVSEPAMVMWGTRDREFDEPLRSNPDARRVIYERIPAQHKYMVDIVNAEHHAFSETRPWYPGGPRDPRHHGWIQQVTTAFFDAHVKGDAAALTWLESDAVLQVGAGEIIYAYGTLSSRSEEGTLYKSGRGPLAVRVLDELMLRDQTRSKDLSVRVTYPAAVGTYPVILLSYYYGGRKEEYGPLVEHWASHGYVTVVPDHSDRGQAGSGRLDFSNRWERVADLRFLIDALGTIEASVGDAGLQLDRDRIGTAGHLYGADTVELMLGLRVFPAQGAAPPPVKDARVRAALVMSAQGRGQGLTEDSWADLTAPLFVVAGSEAPSPRTGNDARWRTEPFVYSPPGDKYLLFVDQLTTTFAGLIIPGRGDNAQIAALVLSGTTAFWDAYLLGSAPAMEILTRKRLAREGVEFETK